MRYRSARVPATAGFALLLAFNGLCANASAHTKTNASPDRPNQLQPPPAQLIKCAIGFDGSPCWPDPGMVGPEQRRWHVDPPLYEPPQFAPYRERRSPRRP